MADDPYIELGGQVAPAITLPVPAGPSIQIGLPLTPSASFCATPSFSSMVQITGSAALSLANFTGIAGVSVFWSGQQVFVSGSSQGVSLLNGLNGAVTLVGQDGVTIGTSGQNLLISGGASGATAQILALSGWAATEIAATGRAGIAYTNTVGNALSGDLSNTGSILAGQIAQSGAALYALTTGVSSGLSSALFDSGQTLSAQIASTGSTLNARIATTGASGIVYATSIGQSLSGDLLSTSGVLVGFTSTVSGVLEQHIADTGRRAILYANGLSGALQSQINSLPTSGAVQASGQRLYQLLTGASGQAQVDYATKAQLIATGATLYGLIVGESGAFNTALALTGQQALQQATTYAQTISGDLTHSGIDLTFQMNAASGVLAAQTFATGYRNLLITSGASGVLQNQINLMPATGTLQSTGQQLYTLFTGYSGYAQSTFATQAQLAQAYIDYRFDIAAASGVLAANTAATGQQAWSAADANARNLSGALTASGAVLIARENALSGVLATTIVQTGRAGVLFTSGASGVLQAQINAFPTPGDITATGATLYADILGLSGVVVSDYATKIALQNTGQDLYFQLENTGATLGASIAATGQQAWTAADVNARNLSGNLGASGATLYALTTGLSGSINTLVAATGQAASNLAVGIGISLSGTLTQSGITLSARDLTISGALEGRIAATGQSAFLATSGVSGALQTQINAIATSSALTQTGATLYGLIIGASGQAQTDYATKTALFTTGSTLSTQITSLSGFTTGMSGALNTTINQNGLGIVSLINGLSGQIALDYATKDQLTQTGVDLGNQIAGVDTNLAATGTSILGLLANLSAGTASPSFQLETGSSGILLKNTPSGLNLRNYNDTLGGDLIVRNLTVQGTQTIANSTNLAVTNQYIYLNQSGIAQDGGVEVLRSGAAAASLLWNESSQRWKAGLSGSESLIVLASDTGGFATQVQVAATGAAAISYTLGASGALSTALFISGQSGIAITLGASGALSAQTAATGANLYALITAASGQGATDYATKTALAQTGSSQYVTTTGLSGAFISQIGLTGAQAIAFAVGIGTISSGNTTATGATLFARDGQISGALEGRIAQTGQSAFLATSGASGVLQTQINTLATSANLGLTGSTLYVDITGLSGVVNTVVAATGAGAIAFAVGVGVISSGNMTATGAALYARDAAISGGLETRIATTGQAAFLATSGASGFLQSQINALPTASQLAQTGSTLYVLTTGFSGQAVTTYATKTQLTQTGVDLIAQNLAMSGVLAASTAVTGATIIPLIYGVGSGVSGNLAASGAALISRDNAISGVLALQTFASGYTGLFALSGASGALQVQINALPTATAIQQTGSILYGLITGQSGQAVADYATKTSLTQTGIDLNAQALAMSGSLVAQIAQTGRAATLLASGIGANLSGNLFATGQAALSYTQSVSGGLEARIAQSGWAGVLVTSGASGVLYALSTGLSGVMNAQDIASGNALLAWNSGVSGVLAGSIALTGSGLFTQLSGVSGALTSGLTATGAAIAFNLTGTSGFYCPTFNNLYVRSGTYDLQTVTITGNYTLTGTESRVYCNNAAPATLSFPSATTFSGYLAKVKLINTGSIYLTGLIPTQTFDGSALYVIAGRYQTREVHSDGANWWVW